MISSDIYPKQVSSYYYLKYDEPPQKIISFFQNQSVFKEREIIILDSAKLINEEIYLKYVTH